MRKFKTVAVALAAVIFWGTAAMAVSDRAVDYLLKTAPRPSGMGGAFTAVPGDPIGIFWNPSAAMMSDRLAISGNHSLRHFPHGRKNLDQLDSDTTGITLPLSGDAIMGIGFTVPGEWGIDHTDTNDVLPDKEKLRGRERRFCYADLHGTEQAGAEFVDSNWYRYDNTDNGSHYRQFDTGGGFSFFYETQNGMMYGAQVRGLSSIVKGNINAVKKALSITFGAAYRADKNAATLAAADLELSWKHGFETRWFGGIERSFDRKGFLRVGSMNGMPTYGAGSRFGSLRLDYAVVKNLMPQITGNEDVKTFQDGHFLSYTLSL
ncbi:MAG TPA: hypothetical protein PLN69_00980 [bacterium]|nr:hypothetical protein [bacterium]